MRFTKREKELSKRPRSKLRERYERTEKNLKAAVNTGEIKKVDAAMSQHHEAEYAMLHKDYSAAKAAKTRKKRAAGTRRPRGR